MVRVVVHICASTHRTKYSLNALSHDTAIGLIRKVIEDGVNLKEVSLYCRMELLVVDILILMLSS